MTGKLTILDVDKFNGEVMVHFSNGRSALFAAEFLWEVREDDGNRAIPEFVGTTDEVWTPDPSDD